MLKLINFFSNNFLKLQRNVVFQIKFFRNINNVESDFDDFDDYLIERINFVDDFLLEIHVIMNCF